MKVSVKSAAMITSFILLMAAGSLAAQQSPETIYSIPIGLTSHDAMRVSMTLLPGQRRQLDRCRARVGVEVLDAADLSVLQAEGPASISIGEGFQADFTFEAGPPPGRQEVIVRVLIQRADRPAGADSARSDSCRLSSSVQLFDVESGRDLIILGFQPAPGGGVYVPI